MRNLPFRISVETLKGHGFSNADIDYSREASEEYRSKLAHKSISDEKHERELDKFQLIYELGVLAGLARARGLAIPKGMSKDIGFQPQQR
jgi:hypothetical protein